jgi:mitogen-activated protein kinase 1/3
MASEEFDHHTLATAATASATISYSSTDHGDDVSEMGMEVIMSENGVHNSIEQTVTEEPYQSHSFPAGKHTFTVDTRYSMIRTIGSGAYGVVISASDTHSDKNVAIKMVPKAFQDEIDAKRILREIKLLKHFRHDNIVSLLDMMPPNVKYLEDFTDVYLVTDLMETDLHRIIYSKQKLSIDHAQYFIYQVLRGLKYIHSCRVLHRDLKPSNLLVNSNCDVKICDFGLARGLNEPNREGRTGTLLLTEYVVTRWYRAPEIMLACHEYSYPIDVWSVGCILAELILRKPYFPGDDYIDQVRIDDPPFRLHCFLYKNFFD